MSKKQKSLPLRGPRLKTNPAVRVTIYKRSDSPYLQVRISGQTTGVCRRSTGSRDTSTAAEFGRLLARHLQRTKQQPPPAR